MDANEFLGELAGVTEPEQKRKGGGGNGMDEWNGRNGWNGSMEWPDSPAEWI